MAPATKTSVAPLPLLYSAFFLYIEPVSTAVGAYYAHFQKQEYMDLTLGSSIGQSAATLFPGVTTREDIVLTQLANLYLVFAFSEALVLRSTNDRAVWKTFLLGLLIADFGHLYSCHYVGWEIFYQPWTWNSIYWGNIGFVYVGAAMRIAFLLGIGFNKNAAKTKVKA